MFVTLTDDMNKTEVRVNISHIKHYYGSEHGSYVAVTDSPVAFFVKDTPKQIDNMIYATRQEAARMFHESR